MNAERRIIAALPRLALSLAIRTEMHPNEADETLLASLRWLPVASRGWCEIPCRRRLIAAENSKLTSMTHETAFYREGRKHRAEAYE
jgi:hypothetical protein